jgi:hypothetical protein
MNKLLSKGKKFPCIALFLLNSFGDTTVIVGETLLPSTWGIVAKKESGPSSNLHSGANPICVNYFSSQ